MKKFVKFLKSTLKIIGWFALGALIVTVLVAVILRIVGVRIAQTPNDPNDAVYSPVTGFIIDTKEPEAPVTSPSDPPVVFETDPVRGEAVTEVEDEQPDILEVGTGTEITVGLKNYLLNPRVPVPPKNAVFWSTSQATLKVIDQETPMPGGSVGYFYNKSEKIVDVVFSYERYLLDFNEINERWPVDPVLFQVLNPDVLLDYALYKNFTEHKPQVVALIWDGNELVQDPKLQEGLLSKSSIEITIGRAEGTPVFNLKEIGDDVSTGVAFNKDEDTHFTLQPGQGAKFSSDDGKLIIGEKEIPMPKGFAGYVINSSEDPVLVKIITGWNTEQDPDRWNASFVMFDKDDNLLSLLRDYATEKNNHEGKPTFVGYIWDGSVTADPDL